MTEKRFTFDYVYQFEIYDNQTKKHYDGTVGCQEKLCDLLNSLVDEIDDLNKEIKRFKRQVKTFKEDRDANFKSAEYWKNKTKEFNYYFNCLEKAIDKTFDSEDQSLDEIWKHYSELEKRGGYENNKVIGND